MAVDGAESSASDKESGLRDHFASLIMTRAFDEIIKGQTYYSDLDWPSKIARVSYTVADAMILARNAK